MVCGGAYTPVVGGEVPRLRSGRLRSHGYAGVLAGWKRILASPMR